MFSTPSRPPPNTTADTLTNINLVVVFGEGAGGGGGSLHFPNKKASELKRVRKLFVFNLYYGVGENNGVKVLVGALVGMGVTRLIGTMMIQPGSMIVLSPSFKTSLLAATMASIVVWN